jgi:uncharacterized protein YbcI
MAKWIKECRKLPMRLSIKFKEYLLLTSFVGCTTKSEKTWASSNEYRIPVSTINLSFDHNTEELTPLLSYDFFE